jgi:hypothetical protein
MSEGSLNEGIKKYPPYNSQRLFNQTFLYLGATPSENLWQEYVQRIQESAAC